MDPARDEDYVFDLKLARSLGFVEIVHPDTTKIFGRGVYRTVSVALLCFMGITSLLMPLGLYRTSNDPYTFIYYFACEFNQLFNTCKGLYMVYRSADIWECMNVASFGLASYRRYDRNVFDRWRKYSARLSNAYFAALALPCLFWFSTPFLFRDAALTVKNLNGSYSEYRYNTINKFLMLSDDACNEHFYLFYLTETIICAVYYYFILLMDIVVVFLCVAISCKLDLVCHAIESLWSETRSTNNLCTRYA